MKIKIINSDHLEIGSEHFVIGDVVDGKGRAKFRLLNVDLDSEEPFSTEFARNCKIIEEE